MEFITYMGYMVFLGELYINLEMILFINYVVNANQSQLAIESLPHITLTSHCASIS